MAYTTLTMENNNTGGIKQAPVGFSWTCFFFGGLVPLFRGHNWCRTCMDNIMHRYFWCGQSCVDLYLQQTVFKLSDWRRL